MKILKSDLQGAANKGIITEGQASDLWSYLVSLREDQPKFQALHVLYYFGGILVLSSMSWFLTNAWNNPAAIISISAGFALMYLFVGHNLWNRQNIKIPGGLLITAAVALTPLFIYGLQQHLGMWPQRAPNNYHDYHVQVKGCWIFMEIGTIIAALIALRFYKFTFLTFPLALSLWYISMDLTPLIFGKDEYSFEERKVVSCVFGLIVLVGSYLIDKKFKEHDFAFWTYLYGMLAFWGGLTLMDSNSELGKFIYCMINVGFIITSVYLRRKIFMILGTIGVLAYISHLAWDLFKDSTAFPLVLTFLGVFIILLGVKYQKNKARVEAKIESWIPTFLNKWRPEERA